MRIAWLQGFLSSHDFYEQVSKVGWGISTYSLAWLSSSFNMKVNLAFCD